MKQFVRKFILFVIVFAPIFTHAQAQTSPAVQTRSTGCPGVPGACGYHPQNVSDPNARQSPPMSPQNGNGTLGVIYDQAKCGLDYTSASQRLGKRFSPAGVNQPAPFVISGIPACAVIEKAYLWAEGSGNGAAQTATVNGPLGSANYPMTIVGQGPDKCWGYSGTYTYRADVTASVNGNGTYNISGILTNPPTAGNDMDGATLVVIWSQPSANWQGRVILADGAYVVNGGVANYVMPISPAVCGATTNAKAFLCVGDIQFNPTSWTLNGTAGALTWNWWDYVQVNTTVAAGQATSTFNVNTGGDCFNLCVTGLYFRTTTCAVCPSTTAITVTPSSTPATCSACNGTASVTVSPAGAYTYNWSPAPGAGQGTANVSGLCAGVYTVTVTSSCATVTATVNVATSGGSITLNNSGQTNVTCNGACNGSASITAVGGTAPYTFTWSPAATNSTAGATNTGTGLCAGTYTVNCTDAGGCTGSLVVTITQPPPVTFTQSQVNVTCNGACNGSATVVASGGNGTYSYAWSPSGGTGATASGLCAGTYTCVITSGPSTCTTSAVFTITQPPVITFTQSQVNVTCNGACNGSATVVASGGTGTYTYAWSPSGGTGATASGLCAGTYTCVITSGPSTCTTSAVFTITQPPAITFTQSQVNVTCNGACNGSATVVASGGTGTYTYAWSPSGGTGATASGLCAGTYTCVITSGPSTCTTSAVFTITQPPAITFTQSQVNVTCNAACNGSATVVASGGTGTYTYAWSPSGGTGATATGLCAGTYTCVITSGPSTCTTSAVFNITQPAALNATSATTPATCGNPNGSATVTVTGGTGAYSYSWSPSGGNGATATGLSAGPYVVTITDANSCSTTITVTITNAGSPTITITSTTNVSCYNGNNGSINTTTSGGSSPYTYSWTPSGSSANPTGLTAGSYVVTVTDANGCTATANTTITQPPQLTASATASPVLCNGGNTGSATATATGGTPNYSYSWSPSGGTGATANNLSSQLYTCTITDANGCTVTATANVTQPTALAVTGTQVDELCNGGSTGSASVTVTGGTTSYTYNWSPAPGGGQGTANATGLTAQTYVCTITDANGCTISYTFTITEPAQLTVSTSAVPSTCGAANGSATATGSGGTGTYTYAWTPGNYTTATISNVMAGNYAVTITDQNGCTASAVTTINNLGSPTLTVTSATSISCFGGNDGDIITGVSGGNGPYTYSWTPSAGTGSTATTLTAGGYTCTVTDANGCTDTAATTLTEPPQLIASATSTPVLCFGGSTGSATVTYSGGTGVSTIAWSPSGGTNATAPNLAAGTYTATVTDANGCTDTASTTVTEPPVLAATASQVDELCFGGTNASATVNVTGGTPNYTYTWSPAPGGGQGTATATGLTAQAYTCVIDDANGCSVTMSFTITEPSAVMASATSVDAHCNQADGSASGSATGGTGAYTYQWIGGPASQNYNNIAAGPYFVITTDANGCADTAMVTVNNLAGVTAAQGPVTNIGCFGQSTGSITINANGGNPNYTYGWTPNVSASNTASGIPAGNYQVVVTDADGCTSTVNVTLTQPTQLTLAASASPGAICAGQNVQMSGTSGGGTPGYQYAWMPGPLPGLTQTITPTTSGTYTLYITDANNCVDSSTVTVTVNPNPVVALSGDSLAGCAPLCVNFSDLSTLSSGTITSWSWDFGDGNTSTQQNPANCYTTPGAYTVSLTVTSNNGCSSFVTMPNYINAYALPVAAFGASPQPTTILNPILTFTDSSTNASSWLWSFGDIPGSTSTQQNPQFEYLTPDCYQVVLEVTSPDGCTDTAMHTVCISPDVSIYVPNAFTPNDDNRNDYFYPVCIGIDPEQYELWIFDRWGNLIFYTDDLNKGWDGRVQGSEPICQIDTYVWKIKAKDINGGSHNLVGKVSLIK